ncbi:MAG: methionine--tRNA ligase [Candidatus Buchananbacteria bacterium]
MSKFYLTTTLPYVNAEPHIGFALEIVQADVIARAQRFFGAEVFFNTGTDEHGLKIYQKALEEGKEPQAYCDEYAAKFDALKANLNLSYNNFIRTTDPAHILAAQEFWQLCDKKGDIYKKNYLAKYCVGCEMEKTDSELVEGECPIHPNLAIQIIEEENYFFKFSKYQQPLLDFYAKQPDFVWPKHRQTEITNFVKNGLQDFSISRLKNKMPWGIPVPGDEEQVMYVWFDALINYISCLGWPDDEKKFKEFWPGVQTAGKDNLRHQTAMWQAMLMSADLPNSSRVLIHGFITSGGQKMSKSLGNVVNPFTLVEKFGTDAVRYYLLSEIPPFEDGDFTQEKFSLRYNADLANGLGNLVSRVTNLIASNNIKLELRVDGGQALGEIKTELDNYQFNEALAKIWRNLSAVDGQINTDKPWALAKEGKQQELAEALSSYTSQILTAAYQLQPFLPQTAEKIIQGLTVDKIEKISNLFPRLN